MVGMKYYSPLGSKRDEGCGASFRKDQMTFKSHFQVSPVVDFLAQKSQGLDTNEWNMI